jgi:RNA 3'-terminal phosphate cyclase
MHKYSGFNPEGGGTIILEISVPHLRLNCATAEKTTVSTPSIVKA